MTKDPQLAALPLDFTPSEIIDARSPAEFAEDHMPGAINLPVLDDDERSRIGTLYKEDSFEARKAGAAITARRIARHIDEHFAAKGRDYTPLIYCWRGGQRSGSMATVLRAIGWRARVLEGGYKAYRRHVMQTLALVCPHLHLRVINGLTGSGKTKLLQHLAARGRQALDLEQLAAHRSSLLGRYIDRPQPSQCYFETLIADAVSRFDLALPVYVEAESRKVGNLHIPDPLWAALTASPVVELMLPRSERIRHLIAEYEHFLTREEWREHLCDRLDVLKERHGSELIGNWKDQAAAGEWEPLVDSLLAAHYDPLYSGSKKYPKPAAQLGLNDLSSESLDAAIAQMETLAWTKASPPEKNSVQSLRLMGR